MPWFAVLLQRSDDPGRQQEGTIPRGALVGLFGPVAALVLVLVYLQHPHSVLLQDAKMP